MCAQLCLVAQLCLKLSNPMDCSPPGFSVLGFSRQKYRNGLPFPPPGIFLTQESNLHPCIAGGFFIC